LFAKKDGALSNDTQEAFNIFEAENKIAEIERQLRHEFLYGSFANLEGGFGGMDGYRKFCEMRRKIRADRHQDAQQDQENAEAEFWYKIKLYGGGTAIIVVGLLMLYVMIDFAFTMGK
jgi:hypothetical protein